MQKDTASFANDWRVYMTVDGKERVRIVDIEIDSFAGVKFVISSSDD